MVKVYTKSGFWLEETTNKTVRIGISKFGQDELGEIAFFSFQVEDELVAGDVFFSVESTKAVTDTITPISASIVKRNEGLEDSPEDLNDDNLDLTWIVEVKTDEAFDANKFLADDLTII